MRQQTLGAWPDPSTRFEAFEPGPNQSVLNALDGEESMWVHGPHGSGKTHLAHASIEVGGGFYLSLADSDLDPSVLEGLEIFPRLVLDNIDCISGQLEWEERLFGLWNACLDSASVIRVFSTYPVNDLVWAIPDLRSRLAQLPQYALKALDEEALIRLLKRRSETLDLRLSEEVIWYILRRHGRTTHQVVSLFERIAQASLADQKPVTVPFVRSLLIG